MRLLSTLFILLLMTPAFAGCLTPSSGTIVSPTAASLPCEHPWPCGDEWPAGLEGPFDLAEVQEVRVASHDGVELHGWIYLPDVPGGVKVPTVLWSHPYFSVNYPSGDHPEYWENAVDWGAGLDVKTLVENGYAFAAFSVRGTGESGGCFSMGGTPEQKDQAFLVEWLAAQPWSNGRVGMMGLSYHGTTPWMAAIQAPEALKTLVVAGMVSDFYTFYHTPQGAVSTIGAGFQAAFNGIVGSPPRNTHEGPPEGWDAYATGLPERACPEVAWSVGNLAAGTTTDVRDAGFWNERRYVDGFPNVTAAVLLTHGFQDAWSSGHQMQESAAWAALTQAPKWQVEGQWGHAFPHEDGVPEHARLPGFGDRILAWLDFWLKGLGNSPEELGTVDYQDGAGGWHHSTAWPPAEARDEVLYLTPAGLRDTSESGARRFLSAPDELAAQRDWAEGRWRPAGPICSTLAAPVGEPTSLLYVSEPAEGDVLVAGNPHAYLRLSSDLAGGLVAVSLFDLAPDFSCDNGAARGVRAWTLGVADLRFHDGGFQGEDFPTGVPVQVRIDLTNLAEVLPAGHRLAALVHYPDVVLRTGQPYLPTLTVHADGGPEASHLVVPVVEGTLGGMAPTVDYPPRPFTPSATR